MIMKYRTLHPYLAALAVSLILCVGGFTYLFGPVDPVPRLHASAESPDGAFTVKVYRQRVFSLTHSEVEVIAEVYDRQGELLLEREIFSEGWWHEMDLMFRKVSFVGDEIRIGPKWGADEFVTIRKAEPGVAR